MRDHSEILGDGCVDCGRDLPLCGCGCERCGECVCVSKRKSLEFAKFYGFKNKKRQPKKRQPKKAKARRKAARKAKKKNR